MCRRAITFWEVLVVLVLVILALGVIAPSLLQAQNAASQRRSQNNMKQIGLAAHNYLSVMNNFPSGNDANNFSAAAHLLPYLEQDRLYRTIDFKKPCTDAANATAGKARVMTFVSPNDPQAVVDGPTNYLFNAGSKPLLVNNDGVFYQDSKVKIQQILDGTSNTLLCGETLRGDGSTKATDVKRQYVLLDAKDAEKGVSDQVVNQKWKASENIAGDRCARWIDGRFLQGTFTGTHRANDPIPDVSFGGVGGASGLRSLEETVNIGFCDGSVRPARIAKMDKAVWAALCTRAGGEVIAADF